ncbi:MAG: AAA family ATPase [Candidatus Cybelea sp.]
MVVGAPLSCRRLVGREREVAALRERFSEAHRGRGSLVIVTGEAGIGKTRFLLEGLKELKAEGATCLRSQFFEHVSTPMGPLVEIFRELYKIVPAAIGNGSAPAGFGRAESGGSDNVIFDSRASQFGSIADTLLRCAADIPLLIAIEDIHWADPATLECLQYLASRVESARLLFVLTCRSESVDRRPTPVAEFSKLAHQAHVWHIALEPLEDQAMQALVNETLPADHQFSGGDRFRIIELAEGNPLFAEELLKHGLEFGASRRLPASISAIFLQRLESFSAQGRFLLSQAAVIGKRFDAKLLAQVSNQPFEAILVVLRTARQLQLIVEDLELASSYNFRHALVREALYEELLAVEVATLHRRIAEYLEKLPESEERTIELAYHWWAARKPAKAVQYNGAAAEIAAARFATENAVRYYDRALEFTQEGTLTQADLRHRQGRQLGESSQLNRAIDVLEPAFEYFERHRLIDRVADTAFQLGSHQWRLGRGDDAVIWFERSLEAMGDNLAHPNRTKGLINLATVKVLQGSLEQARAYATAGEESLFAASPQERAQYFQLLLILATESGDFASALAAYERICSEFDNPKPRAFALDRHVWLNIAVAFHKFGRLDISKRALERVRLAELANPSFASFMESTPVVVSHLMFGGRFADAGELVKEYWAKQTTETTSSARKHIVFVAASLAARLLRPDLLAEIAADEMIELTFDSTDKACIIATAACYAEWFAAIEERTKARELIARAIAVIGDPGCDACGAVTFALYGDTAAARWAHDILVRWAAPASNRIGRAYLALVDAIALGRAPKRAARLARSAAEGFRESGLPYYEALALERCGNEKQALEIYRRIGDVGDAQRLAAEIDPMNRRGRRAAELTARESEIADLIAEGKSNRVIAEKLVVSQRTVETHVASIFSKLEVSARDEVADRVAQHH